MISFFSKFKRPIFIVVVVVFVGSIFFISGEVFTASSDGAVAEVGGTKIPYKTFKIGRASCRVRVC